MLNNLKTSKIILILLLTVIVCQGASPKWQKTASGSIYLKADNGDAATLSIGTTDNSSILNVKGIIYTEGMVVNAVWPDYVFDDGYELWSLEKVDRFIQTNKYLPGIPSAKEMEADGVSLGEMQARLLAKVEELTLHVIKQQEMIDSLKVEMGGGQ